MAVQIPLEVLHDLFTGLCKDVGERPSKEEAVAFKKRLAMRCRDRTIDMREMRLGAATAMVLSKALTHNPNSHTAPSPGLVALRGQVRKIDLYGNGVRNAGAVAMAQLLSTSQCNITEANFGCNEIGDEGGRVIGMSLRVNNSLRRLELGAEGAFWHDNHIGADGGIAIGEGLERNQTLTYLGLSQNHIGKHHNKGVDALARALRAATCPLKVLKLAKNNLSPRATIGLLEALSTNEKLVQLDLSNNKFPNSDVGDAVADVVRTHPALTSLNLAGCELGPRGVSSICMAMATEDAQMLTINFDMNNCGEEGAHAVAQMLTANVRISALYLGANQVGPSGGGAIAESLQNHPSLKVLSLRKNRLGNSVAIDIAQSLTVSETSVLQTLDLSGSQMGGPGGMALAEMCKAHPDGALSILKLADNFITEADGRKIIDVLKHNRRILNVNMRGNQLNHKTTLAAKKLCKVNRQRKKNADIAPLHQEMHRLQALEAKLPDRKSALKMEQDALVQAKADTKETKEEKARTKKDAAHTMARLKQQLSDAETRVQHETKTVQEREADLTKTHKEFDMKISDNQEALTGELEKKEALERELDEKSKALNNTEKLHSDWVSQIREQMEELRAETEVLRARAQEIEPELEELTQQAKAAGKSEKPAAKPKKSSKR